MGRIREYNNTQTVDPQPLEQAAYRVERTGMIEGAAYRDLGNSGQKVLNRFEDAMATRETSDLAAKMSQLDLDTTKSYEDAKNSGDMNDPEFATKFVEKNLQPQLDKLGDGIMTRKGQEMYQQASLKLTSEYTKRALADQATFAGNQAIENYKGTVTSYVNAATDDPTTTEHAAKMIDIMAPNLPNEHRAALTLAAKQEIYGAGAQGYLVAAIKNPNSTDATLDQAWQHVEQFRDHVDPGRYASLQKEYLTAKDTLGAARSAMADQNWGDLVGRIQQNGGQDVDRSAQSLIDTYQGRNAAETQLWKASHQKQLDEAMAYGKASEGVRTTPENEVTMNIQAVQDQIDRAAPGDVGRLTAQRDAMVSALKQRDKEFMSDQAAYVMQNSAVVATRAQDYAKNPNAQTFDAFAQASIAEQRRLYPTVMPRLVTKDMSQAIGSEMAAVPNTPEGAAQAGQSLSTWAQVGGKYWPQMAQELYHDKVLNPSQFVAASVWTKPEARTLAQDLLRASTMKPEELSKISPVTEAKAAKAARDALAPLQKTLVDAANGGELMDAYSGALSTLVRYKGDPKAATAMATKMILGEYQFSGTLRMPTNVDMGNVVAGTKAVQADIGNHNLVIPPSYSGAGPHDQRAEYAHAIHANGHWSTSSDGKTALLYDEQGAPVYETIHGHRAQVALDWATLEKLGSK